jgi:hypothetical protein
MNSEAVGFDDVGINPIEEPALPNCGGIPQRVGVAVKQTLSGIPTDAGAELVPHTQPNE